MAVGFSNCMELPGSGLGAGRLVEADPPIELSEPSWFADVTRDANSCRGIKVLRSYHVLPFNFYMICCLRNFGKHFIFPWNILKTIEMYSMMCLAHNLHIGIVCRGWHVLANNLLQRRRLHIEVHAAATCVPSIFKQQRAKVQLKA